MVGKLGVLALQGAFTKHRTMLDRLGVASIEVRTSQELAECDGLIIPGGESTAMLQLNTLPLADFDKPIFGTCAGMILMARFGLLAIALERNAYGRQCNSFSTDLTVYLDKPHTMHAIFIRAPRIKAILSSKVEILARISHQISEQIAPLSPQIASQHGEDSVHETRTHRAGEQDGVTRERFVQRSGEKCGLADIPVIVRQGDYLATTFHPELTDDPTLHHYFIQMCKSGRKSG